MPATIHPLKRMSGMAMVCMLRKRMMPALAGVPRGESSGTLIKAISSIITAEYKKGLINCTETHRLVMTKERLSDHWLTSNSLPRRFQKKQSV